MGRSYKKQRIEMCSRLALHYYFNDTNTIAEFEALITGSGKNLEKFEKEGILKHFKKEVYPVDKKIAEWMWGLGSKIDINFHSQIKKLKKEGFKYEAI